MFARNKSLPNWIVCSLALALMIPSLGIQATSSAQARVYVITQEYSAGDPKNPETYGPFQPDVASWQTTVGDPRNPETYGPFQPDVASWQKQADEQ